MKDKILIDALEIISQTIASTPSHSKIATEALSQYRQSPQTAGAVWPTDEQIAVELIARYNGNARGNKIAKKSFVDAIEWLKTRSESSGDKDSEREEYSDEILKEWAAKADFVIAKDKEIQKLQESLLDVATKSMQEIESLKSLVEEAVDILDDVFYEPELTLEIGRKIRSFKIANNL